MVKGGLPYLIVFLLILLIPNVLAKNITVDYPEEIEIGKDFLIKLELSDFEEGMYDVKIDLIGSGQRIAKILNNEQWKSTYYYISEAISNGEEEKFTLKIEEYFGNVDFDIKIRDSSNVVTIFSGYELVSKGSIEEIFEPETNETESEQEEIEAEKDETPSEEEIETPEEEIEIPEEEIIEVVEPEPIKLSPKDIKTKDYKKNLDKSEYAIIGFIIFCILLIILFTIKRRK